MLIKHSTGCLPVKLRIMLQNGSLSSARKNALLTFRERFVLELIKTYINILIDKYKLMYANKHCLNIYRKNIVFGSGTIFSFPKLSRGKCRGNFHLRNECFNPREISIRCGKCLHILYSPRIYSL